jgi:HSP20 family protein
MALLRWEPVAELNTLQTEMNRLFNTVFDPSTRTTRDASGGTSPRWLPPMDLLETREHYVLRADLPGLADEDVNVQFEDNVLTISGERTAEHDDQPGGYYRLERAFGAFSRSLTLPDGVDPDTVQAHFERGVLEVTVPKPEQKKPRQVQIKLGDRKTIESDTTEGTTSNTGKPEPASTPA